MPRRHGNARSGKTYTKKAPVTIKKAGSAISIVPKGGVTLTPKADNSLVTSLTPADTTQQTSVPVEVQEWDQSWFKEVTCGYYSSESLVSSGPSILAGLCVCECLVIILKLV